MPDITETTPTEDYTIAGNTFKVYQPYAEGHALTANEASSMNQTFAENIRNNFAKRVKEAVEAGNFDQDTFQGLLNDYMDDYEFGQRTGSGGRVSDPVEAEALRLARDKVKEQLVKKGEKVSDYTAKAITDAAKAYVEKYPQFRATAKAVVEAANSISVEDTADEPAPVKGKKAAAAEAQA